VGPIRSRKKVLKKSKGKNSGATEGDTKWGKKKKGTLVRLLGKNTSQKKREAQNVGLVG